MSRLVAALFLLAAACARTLPSPTVQAGGVVHVVRAGETFESIVRMVGADPEWIAELNDLALPVTLRPGQEVFFPSLREARAARRDDASAGRASLPAKRPTLLSARPAPAMGSRLPNGDEQWRAGAAMPREPNRFQWPARGVLFSSFGGSRGHRHEGIDIAAPAGSKIRAAGDGVVLFSGTLAGYGNCVVLWHGDGIATLYAGNEMNLVSRGDPVKTGAVIARIGTGGDAASPHVHFEVRHGSRPRDPLAYLP